MSKGIARKKKKRKKKEVEDLFLASGLDCYKKLHMDSEALLLAASFLMTRKCHQGSNGYHRVHMGA